MSTVSSKLTHVNSVGNSVAIFIRWERLVFFNLPHKRVFISFIWENLLAIEVVVTGMDKLMEAIVCKFGTIAFIMLSEAKSFNCFRFCGHELSVDLPLRGDLRGDNSLPNSSPAKCCFCRSLLMCQECSNGFISILRQIRWVNTWHFSGIKDAHCWHNITGRAKTARDIIF